MVRQIVWGMIVWFMVGSGVWAQDVDTVMVRIVHSNDVMGQLRPVKYVFNASFKALLVSLPQIKFKRTVNVRYLCVLRMRA